MKNGMPRTAAALGAAAFLFATGFARAEDHASGKAGYLKSATYYSDDWIINFWNSESIHMEEELARIAASGFNNIILVVPRRELQPETASCTCNDYVQDELDRVMKTAADQDPSVILRVGYTWDYYGSDNILNRYRGLMHDKNMRSAWLEYVGRLYERAVSHGNFCGGLLTWEDFWNFTDSSAPLGKGSSGKKMARQCGYTDYAEQNCTLEELEEMYDHFLESYDDLYFPEKDSYARKVFYEFYDQFLNDLMAESQTVFPGLPMGIRLDVDPMDHGDGNRRGFMHPSIFPSGDAVYTSIIYSLPMGFIDEHERVTAEEALDKIPVFLNRLHVYSGGKPIYVDQFLFANNTVGFKHNAQLRDDQKALYLEGVVPVLKNMTMGYGIWAYRDYGDNKPYSAQFGLRQEGRRFFGDSSVTERNGNKMAMLKDGSGIQQNIGNRMTGNTGDDTHVHFKVEGGRKCKLTIRTGTQTRTVEAGKNRIVDINFTNCHVVDFSIEAKGGTVYADDTQVFTFVTQGELCAMDGTEGSCIETLRTMNQKL